VIEFETAVPKDTNPDAGSAPSIVEMSDVRFTWPGRNSFTLSIRRFSLKKGERLLLTGPSGSGKSTFLSLLAGIVTPEHGTIEVLGTDIARLHGAARDRFRAEHYGIIFQMFNLLPYGSVIDNVVLPLRFSRTRRQRTEVQGGVKAAALRLLDHLGIEKMLGNGAAASLSVGQQQRVAAARALIGAPELIIADEPTSSLDRDRQQAFLDLLFADVAAANATLIMVSHDESLSSRFSRVAKLTEICRVSRGGLE
jgi:putative ABC transport system ATP-binding protein